MITSFIWIDPGKECERNLWQTINEILEIAPKPLCWVKCSDNLLFNSVTFVSTHLFINTGTVYVKSGIIKGTFYCKNALFPVNVFIFVQLGKYWLNSSTSQYISCLERQLLQLTNLFCLNQWSLEIAVRPFCQVAISENSHFSNK